MSALGSLANSHGWPKGAKCCVPADANRCHKHSEVKELEVPKTCFGLIHLAQQKQKRTYRVITFFNDAMDGKFGFSSFAETWNGRLAMMGFIIGLGTELLTGQGVLSQIGMG